MDILKRIGSVIWSFLRLVNVLLIAIFSAIHNIIFNQMEVISMTLVLRPQGPERDKLSYIDKLCANNFELAKGGSIPSPDAFDSGDPFMPDDYFDDEDFDEKDFDDNDGGDQQPPNKGDK